MDPETDARVALTPDQAARVAELLDDVARLVDDGEITASSPERAHLVGAADAMKLYSSAGGHLTKKLS